MVFGSIIIVSPIQDFPYGLLLNSTVEPYGQQPISFAPNIQASRLLKLALFFPNQNRPKSPKHP